MINKGATKRAYDSEDEEYSQSLVTRGKTLENTKQEVYAQPDYPEVKYWTKKQWKDAENNNKDASDLLENKDKRRGATRSAMGENVMMLYIEHANGTPIDGVLAAQIREHARMVWKDLDRRGKAPKTWTDASREVHDEYLREMEERYDVLRYCDNHWKANKLATTFYSIWYSQHKKTKARLGKDDLDEGHPLKKARTSSPGSDVRFGDSPQPEKQANGRAVSENPIEDVDGADFKLTSRLSHIQAENRAATSLPSSRPKPRPLKDPL